MKKTISIILALILTLSIVSAAGLYGEAKDINKKKINSRLTGAAVTKLENKITGDVIKAPKEKGNLKFTYDTDKKIVTIEGRIKTEGVMRNARNLYFEDFNINNNRETKYEFFKIQDDMLVLHLVSEKTKLGIAIPAVGKFSKNIILEFDDLKLKTLGVVAYRFSDIKDGTLKIELAGKPEVIEINNNRLKLNKFYEMIEFEEITAEQKELPKSNLLLATGAATKSVKNKLNVDKYFNELFGTSPLTGAVTYEDPYATTTSTTKGTTTKTSTTDTLIYSTFGTATDPSFLGDTPSTGQPIKDIKKKVTKKPANKISDHPGNNIKKKPAKKSNKATYKLFGRAGDPSFLGDTPSTGQPVKDIKKKPANKISGQPVQNIEPKEEGIISKILKIIKGG